MIIENLPPVMLFGEAHYELPMDASISGPFHAYNSPYLIEPARALTDPRIREVNCQFGAQGGKNLLIELFMGYIIIHDPGNILFFGQTDEDAEKFARTRALARIRPLKCMEGIWPDMQFSGAHRVSEARLAHMNIEFIGANMSNTQGKTARYVIRDEAHLWVGVKAGMMAQASNRADGFWDAKILTTSTGADQNTDQDTSWNSGTREIWCIGCPDCGRRVRGRFVQPKWTEKPRFLIWDANEITKPEGKLWNIQEVRKTVRFKCPHEDCGVEYRDSRQMRIEMNLNGAYIVTNPMAATNKRSFRVSQLAYPWVSWEEIVETWICAVERMRTGDPSLLRNCIIKNFAETWKTEIAGGQAQLTYGGYSTKDVFRWEKEKQRYMAVDVQEQGGRHFIYGVYAFSDEGETRLIEAGRLDSWVAVEAKRQQFTISEGRVGIDSNYMPKEVKENCGLRGYTWLEAQETTRSFLHSISGNEKVHRCYSPRVKWDTLIGKRNNPEIRSRVAYGYRYSKRWAMEVVHHRVSGVGAKFEVPSDVAEFKWKGTNYEQTSYLEQIGSWVPVSVTDENTNQTKRTWKKTYKEDHSSAALEMALVLACIDRLVPSDVGE